MNQFISFFEEKGIGVFPMIIQAVGVKKINEILFKYKNNERYKIFCIIDDWEFDIQSYENQIILRTSAKKSKLKANEYIFPYFYYCQNEPQDILPRSTRPIVGFCGENSKYRKKILNLIQCDQRFEDNFIIRDQFWAGKPNNPEVIQDFESNMLSSHFNICNRGRGNFTMRFFQALSSCRIPALIDSDISFPLEDQIDYNEFCVVAKNEEDLINKLWRAWVHEDIELMQEKAGAAFYSKLSIHEYHKALYESIF